MQELRAIAGRKTSGAAMRPAMIFKKFRAMSAAMPAHCFVLANRSHDRFLPSPRKATDPGPIAVQDKLNEINAMPRLLDLLNL